jgi:hypothetical protein
MNERKLHEGQWEDRKQWNLVIRQRGRMFRNRLIYILMFWRRFEWKSVGFKFMCL